MIIVTNNNDGGAGSLRAAIAAAAVGEEITFAIAGTITLTSAELGIVQGVIITGPGSGNLTISGGNTFGVFNVSGGIVSLSGMTLTHGAEVFGAALFNSTTLTLSDIKITASSGTVGGGINNGSTIVMTDCLVDGCASVGGVAGGIYNNGTITAVNLIVTNCTSDTDGAAIYNEGTFTHNVGSVTGNIAVGIGGGISNTGTYIPTDVTIGGNTAAGNGGGIQNNLGTLTIKRCTISTNNPIGIYNNLGTVSLDNSTVSGQTNSAIYNAQGAMQILHSTIVSNNFGLIQDIGSVLNIQNTILSGNTTGDVDSDTADITSGGYNIFGVTVNPITPGPSDQSILTFVGLVIGALANNGGPTFTHALLAGSPALDAGTPVGAPATDQRGQPRIVGGGIDIGAFESSISCLIFTGTLPAWLTIDGDCLVVTPNTFRGATKALANAKAQAALNSFVSAALAGGTLRCGACGGDSTVQTTINTGSSKMFGIAYAPNDDRMFVGEQFTTDPKIFVIDCVTNTVVNTLVLTGQDGVRQISYGSGQDKIYAITVGATQKLYIIDPTAMTFVSVNLPNKLWQGSAYDSSRDKLYLADFATNGQVRSFDCATATMDAPVYSSGVDASGWLAYAPSSDRIYLGTNSTTVRVLNPATLVLTASVTIPPAGPHDGVDFIAYSALADRVIANHHSAIGVVHFINPATNTVVDTINTASQSLFGLVDDDCRSLVYLGLASVDPRGVGVYQPVSPPVLDSTIAIAAGLNSGFAAYGSVGSRVYFSFDSKIYVLT